LAELRLRFPGLEAFGVGGARMGEQGVVSHCDLNELSVIGLVEVVRRLPRLVTIFWQLVALLKQKRPDLLITIDLPDFNFLLARRAKALGIPRLHYVGPQVWAWRAGRAKRLVHLLDHLMVLFPFEAAFFAGSGLPVTFVGHPLALKPIPDEETRRATRRELGVVEGERLVVVLPGSRLGEIRRHLGVMVATCRLVAQSGKVRFVLALANTLTPLDLEVVLKSEPNPGVRDFFRQIVVRQGETERLVAAADAALVTSGTVTLETALLGTPMTVMYRVNRLTYEIGRRVIRVAHIALPNLVAGRSLVPERIQNDARPEVLADDLRNLLFDGVSGECQRVGFREIRHNLAQPARRPVDVAAELLIHAGF
ncbi:MAG: lipid-A-disaccharide synthase, partial [Magnetococcales bacterium]|nr:lipid-A-disaccharide synthase [Magnetococcales bacterium]